MRRIADNSSTRTDILGYNRTSPDNTPLPKPDTR